MYCNAIERTLFVPLPTSLWEDYYHCEEEEEDHDTAAAAAVAAVSTNASTRTRSRGNRTTQAHSNTILPASIPFKFLSYRSPSEEEAVDNCDDATAATAATTTYNDHFVEHYTGNNRDSDSFNHSINSNINTQASASTRSYKRGSYHSSDSSSSSSAIPKQPCSDDDDDDDDKDDENNNNEQEIHKTNNSSTNNKNRSVSSCQPELSIGRVIPVTFLFNTSRSNTNYTGNSNSSNYSNTNITINQRQKQQQQQQQQQQQYHQNGLSKVTRTKPTVDLFPSSPSTFFSFPPTPPVRIIHDDDERGFPIVRGQPQQKQLQWHSPRPAPTAPKTTTTSAVMCFLASPT